MPKFPIIQQREDVAGPAPTERADVETFAPGWRQVDSAIRLAGEAAQEGVRAGEAGLSGAQAAAQAGERAAQEASKIGDSIARIADPIEKRYNQADLENQVERISKTHMQWAQHALDLIRNDASGDPGLTDKFLEDFDKTTGDLDGDAVTPAGRRYVRERLAEMRASLGVQVMSGQQQKAGEVTRTKAETAINSRAEIARVNPALAAGAMRDVQRDLTLLTSANGLSVAQGKAITQEGLQKVAAGALEGLVQNSPKYVKDQLGKSPEQRDELFQSLAPGMTGALGEHYAEKADRVVKNREEEARAARRDVEERANKAANEKALNFALALSKPGADFVDLGIQLHNSKASDWNGNVHLYENLDALWKAHAENKTNLNLMHGGIVADAINRRVFGNGAQPGEVFKDEGQVWAWLNGMKDKPESPGVPGAETVIQAMRRRDTMEGKGLHELQLQTQKAVRAIPGLSIDFLDAVGKHKDETLYNSWYSEAIQQAKDQEEQGISQKQSWSPEWEGKPNPYWVGNSAKNRQLDPRTVMEFSTVRGYDYKKALMILESARSGENVPKPPAAPLMTLEDIAKRKKRDPRIAPTFDPRVAPGAE